VRRRDVLDEFVVIHETEALVVQDQVVALPPVQLFVNGDAIGAVVAFLDDRELHIRAGADALAQNLLLVRVIVTAATADQERADGFRGISGVTDDGERKHGQENDTAECGACCVHGPSVGMKHET
jgi:hypothetical protein